MLLFWLGVPALACDTTDRLEGFDDWVDGATDVPTDARIVVLGNRSFPVTLTRTDTGEVVEVEAAAYDLPGRHAYTPAALLAPHTTWKAEVTGGYADETFSATFTTGAGPTETGFAGPVLADVAATPWGETDGSSCTGGSPLLVRTVTGALDVPDGLPVGSYVGLRSDSHPAWEHVAPGADHDFELFQDENEGSTDAVLAGRACLTPVVVLPSGAEIAGDTACLEGAEDPAAAKGGCATGGPAASWALAVAAMLGLAVGRSR